MKQESSVDVSNTLSYGISNTLAVMPPVLRIVIRAGDSDDTDSYLFAKSFLIKETRAAGVKVFRDNIEVACRHIVITKPVSQGDCGAICSLAAHFV
jgi:hypothetical protein